MPRRRGGKRKRRPQPLIRRKSLAPQVSPSSVVLSAPETKELKVAFGMIVYNGAYVLEPLLESIYPFAAQIIIAEGPVHYFASKGATRSTDGTIEIIKGFADPRDKIRMVHGPWSEKDEMVNGYVGLLRGDIDYLWHIDSDEIFKAKDVEAILGLLPGYDSVGFRSLTFFGGLDYILTGFEQNAEFERIKRWPSGARWTTHRPPTVVDPQTGKPMREGRHLGYDTLADRGIYMYHYSYVWGNQVRQKTPYIHDALSPGNCIDDFYERVYKPWVTGDASQRQAIEDEFDGVHDFLPSYRGPCRTELFKGEHPEPIAKRLAQLRELVVKEL